MHGRFRALKNRECSLLDLTISGGQPRQFWESQNSPITIPVILIAPGDKNFLDCKHPNLYCCTQQPLLSHLRTLLLLVLWLQELRRMLMMRATPPVLAPSCDDLPPWTVLFPHTTPGLDARSRSHRGERARDLDVFAQGCWSLACWRQPPGSPAVGPRVRPQPHMAWRYHRREDTEGPETDGCWFASHCHGGAEGQAVCRL